MRRYTLLLLLICFESQAQVRSPREFVISHWTLEDGLPQSSINAVLQTRDHFLWLTSFGGLIRFDGVKFTVFDRFNSPGMLSDRTLILFEDREGGLWIDSELGLIHYSNGQFRTFTDKDGLQQRIVEKVIQDSSGSIWVRTTNDIIYKYINDRFVQQEVVNDSDLRKRALNGEGEFCFRFHTQVVKLIEGRFVALFETDSHPTNAVEYPRGTFWVSTWGNGMLCYSKGTIKRYTMRDGLPSNNIRKIIIDTNGDIWTVGDRGVSRIRTSSRNEISTFTTMDGLSDIYTNDIIQDHEGSYWIGTQIGGLNKLRKAVVTAYGAGQGLEEEKVLSLCFRKNGTLLIGTNGGGVYEMLPTTSRQRGTWQGIRISPFNKFIPHGSSVWSVFEDSKQRVWIGADELTLIDGGRVSVFPPPRNAHSEKNGFIGKYIQAIYEDKSGAIWVGCKNGAFKYSEETFRRYSVEEGLSENDVRSFLEDSKGNVWIGTVAGLNKISNGKIEVFTSIPGSRSNYIRSIYQDRDGVLWFGSYGGGLIRLKDSQFKVFTTRDGLFDNIVSHVVEDDSGYFWMGCNRGISRVSRKELNEYADGKTKTLFVTSYGKQDGMVTVETNGGFQPSAVKDAEGKIYFPTVKGFAVVDPLAVSINKHKPEVHFDGFVVRGEERNISNAHIAYDSSDIQIGYTALSFVDPKKVRFKYKMEGYDHDWASAGTRRSAFYPQLPPGEYTFTVIACNNDGIWNEKGTSVSFAILPPFWMTWWFRTILILLFLSIGPMIYYRRVTTLQKEKKRQEEFSRELIMLQEQERRRIAAELHDGLGQTLLIIKNRALMGLNLTTRNTKQKRQLEEISTSASNAINEAREIAYSLRPYQLDRMGITKALDAMVKKVALSSNIPFEVQIKPLEKLFRPEEEINLFRIAQESVNNVVRHSDATRALVQITHRNGVLTMKVQDNGKGITVQEEPRDDAPRQGFGMIGMSERVRLLNGSMDVRSTPGAGTTITVIIPVRRPSNES